MAENNDCQQRELRLGAIDPSNGKHCVLHLTYDRVSEATRRNRIEAYRCAHLVPEVVQQPMAVFGGLREGVAVKASCVTKGNCYCGKPSIDYTKDGKVIKAPDGEFFLVFVNDEGYIYNWYWEKAGDLDDDLPEGNEVRFLERLL